MYDFLKNLDRRWIFLLMILSVMIPVYVIGTTKRTFPEKALPLGTAVFDEIERLEEGDKVLLAFDFDQGSEGELGPMATSFARHCCEKKLKMYFLASSRGTAARRSSRCTSWPCGPSGRR